MNKLLVVLCLSLAGCAQAPAQAKCEPLPKIKSNPTSKDYATHIRTIAQLYAKCAGSR